jgi:hypothetical protein
MTIRPVGKVFHFSASPTVTAGFIGFVFDIREVIKVACRSVGSFERARL